MRREIGTRLVAVILFASLPPILGGCPYVLGEWVPTSTIQAFLRGQTREEAIRTIDEAMTASAFHRVGTATDARLADRTVAIEFMALAGNPDAEVTIEERIGGSRVCIQFRGVMGQDGFPPSVKAEIVRVRAALESKVGKPYVAGAPCDAEPYWPVATF
ncbi:MAG TPA: hypothetical protein VMQ73_03635 [Methylomirabilota bacterium]|nr:hypothetical protein [Methylomirabilota bacterium]